MRQQYLTNWFSAFSSLIKINFTYQNDWFDTPLVNHIDGLKNEQAWNKWTKTPDQFMRQDHVTIETTNSGRFIQTVLTNAETATSYVYQANNGLVLS